MLFNFTVDNKHIYIFLYHFYVFVFVSPFYCQLPQAFCRTARGTVLVDFLQ